MISWLNYSKRALQRAEEENKPIFLHVSAKWSLFCRKMRENILNDSDIVDTIEKNFIPVQVDKEQRPDIDSIYQKASHVLGLGSGWPLNLFLNSDGKPFGGITYKEEEKENFKTQLEKAFESYRSNKEKFDSRAQVIVDAIKPIEVVPSDIREDFLQNPEEDILTEIDFEYGGFKKTPKFPPFAHVDLLLWRYWIRPKPWVFNAIEKTLNCMVSGGIYDHIEGGFHRYCIDRAWNIPHFEKLAVDNAWHIINFLDAYNIMKSSFYKEIASQTIDYIRENLLSPENSFYASQFGDSIYYTWDESELQEISPMTLALVDGNAMVDGRFILIGRDRTLISQLREKFLSKLKNRKKPDVDKTIFCSINAICAEAFVKAWRVLGNEVYLNSAIKSIEHTLNSLFIGKALYRTDEDVPALLEDFAYMISSLITLYEVTAERRYKDIAITLMDLALEILWDDKNGGFFDSPEPIISIRQKSINDMPYPSANSIMIINLSKLYAITGDERFRNLANFALKAFSNLSSAYLTPYYIRALISYFDLLTLNFHTSKDSLIGKSAIHQITPFTLIVHRDSSGEYIMPSLGSKIFEPLRTPEDLSKFLRL